MDVFAALDAHPERFSFAPPGSAVLPFAADLSALETVAVPVFAVLLAFLYPFALDFSVAVVCFDLADLGAGVAVADLLSPSAGFVDLVGLCLAPDLFDPVGLGPGFASGSAYSSADLSFVHPSSDLPSFALGLFYRFCFSFSAGTPDCTWRPCRLDLEQELSYRNRSLARNSRACTGRFQYCRARGLSAAGL